jgi:hypothetical protein
MQTLDQEIMHTLWHWTIARMDDADQIMAKKEGNWTILEVTCFKKIFGGKSFEKNIQAQNLQSLAKRFFSRLCLKCFKFKNIYDQSWSSFLPLKRTLISFFCWWWRSSYVSRKRYTRAQEFSLQVLLHGDRCSDPWVISLL